MYHGRCGAKSIRESKTKSCGKKRRKKGRGVACLLPDVLIPLLAPGKSRRWL